jgi:hypothetical protein
MKKLCITSTLVMLGYLVVFKIVVEVMALFQYMWGIEASLSFRQLWAWQIMDGIKEIMMFVAAMLFIFLLVNILVTSYDNKKGAK